MSEDGREMFEVLFGGVPDLVPSRPLEWEAPWSMAVEADCGMEPSNSSVRRRLENVRFASSAE